MKKLLIVSFCILMQIPIFAQETERDANYHYKQENFVVAVDMYEELVEKDTANIELNYRLGVCYLNTNKNPKAALKHFQIAASDKSKDPLFLFELGKAYLFNYNFDEAIEAFKQACIECDKKPEMKELVEVWVKMTENARKYTRKPQDVTFVNLGKYINSKINEITPMVTANGELLLFTSDRKFDRAFSMYTYDVYYSELTDNDYTKAKSLTAVNSMDDEFLAGLSANGDKIFAQLQGYEAFEDLAVSNYDGKRFDRKEILQGEVNSKSSEYGATLSITGDTLFFSSSREGGKGGMDLYFCKKLPTGAWGIPTNLGGKINTVYDEDFPLITADGKTMYFCSNSPKSMGGYDVFKTKLLPNGEFTEPVNLGFPLNDVFDNKTIAFSPNHRYAYVSAIRSDSYGYADIYRVVFNQNDPSVKIFILKMKTGPKEQRIDYAATDTTLNIKAFKKGKVLIGEYAYNSKQSQATIALPPGAYQIEISGKATETKTIKINVDDAPGTEKIVKKAVLLKSK